MDGQKATFNVGQIVHHKLLNYRGVIIDVDPIFQGTDEWYDLMAYNHPPKDAPWYHILVDDAVYRTYVAEQNLEPDSTNEPVNHPEIDYFFDEYQNGSYVPHRTTN